jgi:beta-lactam-binding protein with PASTA domain
MTQYGGPSRRLRLRLAAAVLVGAGLLIGTTACGPVHVVPVSSESGAPPATTAAGVSMPNLVGVNAKAAQDQLGTLGISSHNVTFGSADPHASVVILAANWTVTAQSVPAGTTVSASTKVVLTVVKTADLGTPTVVAMPDLVGLNGQVAVDKLTALGFSRLHIGFGSADPNASVVILPVNWKVVAQSVPAGAQVDVTSSITLTAVKLTT